MHAGENDECRTSRNGTRRGPVGRARPDPLLRGQHCLARVDLALDPGSVLGLIGRIGAGKSTFIRAMPRLLEPLSGVVFVFGEPA